jgi:hypothetical protein
MKLLEDGGNDFNENDKGDSELAVTKVSVQSKL